MVHFYECYTVAANCSTVTQIEMRDRTVEHFPGAVGIGGDEGHSGEGDVVEGGHAVQLGDLAESNVSRVAPRVGDR